MSKDKYPSIFSPQMTQMEAIVFIILQIFSPTRALLGKKRKKNRRIQVLDDYYYQTTSSVAKQNEGFELVHQLGDTNLGYSPVDIPQFQLGNIRSCDVFRPITRKRKDLMDYNSGYQWFSVATSGYQLFLNYPIWYSLSSSHWFQALELTTNYYQVDNSIFQISENFKKEKFILTQGVLGNKGTQPFNFREQGKFLSNFQGTRDIFNY